MADLLIKGMEMPKSCKECELMMDCDSCEGWEVVCVLQGCLGYLRDLPEDKRLEDCPLVEVPAHGRLVDADLLYDKWMWGSTDRTAKTKCIELIDLSLAPTVIEASDSNALNALDALEVEE